MLRSRLNYFYPLVLLGTISMFTSPPAFPQTHTDTSIVGNWQGTLSAMGTKLRIVFHVSEADSGGFKGTADSPDQGALGMPLSSVTVTGDSVSLGLAVVGGSYEGEFSPDKSSIAGKWRQGGAAFDLRLEKTTVEIKLNRPQEPKPPFPYKSEEVTYENKGAGIRLAGTLTLPDSGGPFPAVIMITGSGPENRDEELLGHKPFLVIADYLTRHGIAVLRADDRGVGSSTGGRWDDYTTADYSTDVLAGISFLKNRSDIDHKRIGLIGHSEGGIIAPMVAAESPDVAFIIMMAGTGYRGDKVIVDQTGLIEKADGASEEKISNDVRLLKEEISIVESGTDSAATAERLRRYLASTYSIWGAELSKSETDSARIIDMQIRNLDSRWFRYFLTYDPLPALRKVKCPVLAIGGTLDMQVPAEENLKAIEAALKAGGNADYSVRLLPGVNHLFQDAATGSPNEYAKIDETISPTVLELMQEWIAQRTAR